MAHIDNARYMKMEFGGFNKQHSKKNHHAGYRPSGRRAASRERNELRYYLG